MKRSEIAEYIERNSTQIVEAKFSSFDAAPGRVVVLLCVVLPAIVGFLISLQWALVTLLSMLFVVALEIGLTTIGFWLEMRAKAEALQALALSTRSEVESDG
jgi:hypothetical protein